jgi:hypothetical protein
VCAEHESRLGKDPLGPRSAPCLCSQLHCFPNHQPCPLQSPRPLFFTTDLLGKPFTRLIYFCTISFAKIGMIALQGWTGDPQCTNRSTTMTEVTTIAASKFTVRTVTVQAKRGVSSTRSTLSVRLSQWKLRPWCVCVLFSPNSERDPAVNRSP